MSWLMFKKDGYGTRLEWIQHATALAMVEAGRAKYELGLYWEIMESIPVNTTPPSITGNTVVGQVLTCNPGEWDDPTLIFSYQWLADGVAISGATGKTRTLQAAQAGAMISCTVTARNSAGSWPATSAEVGPVTAVPANTAAPSISGTAQVGQTLTAADGTWTGTPTPTLTRQWNADGTAISGATAATYVPVAGDIGKVITVTVTGTNSAGNANATSAGTAAVIDVA